MNNINNKLLYSITGSIGIIRQLTAPSIKRDDAVMYS